MSENIEQDDDLVDLEAAKDLHDKMHSILENEVKSMPNIGVCVFAFFPADDGMRIAHMSNMENANLTALMKEWIICQEKANGRDRIN